MTAINSNIEALVQNIAQNTVNNGVTYSRDELEDLFADTSYFNAGEQGQEAIQEQIDKIEQRKINTLCKFADGTITAEEKDLIVNKCNSDMSYKQLELDEANSHKLITEPQVEYVCNFMTIPAKMWRDAGFESKVALEKMIFPNGLEFDIKARKFGTGQISPIFSAISPKKSPKGSNNDVWCARYDSNVRPSVPQTDALSS